MGRLAGATFGGEEVAGPIHRNGRAMEKQDIMANELSGDFPLERNGLQVRIGMVGETKPLQFGLPGAQLPLQFNVLLGQGNGKLRRFLAQIFPAELPGAFMYGGYPNGAAGDLNYKVGHLPHPIEMSFNNENSSTQNSHTAIIVAYWVVFVTKELNFSFRVSSCGYNNTR